MGKSKNAMGMSDYVTIGFGILGCLICCGASVAAPYRKAKPIGELDWPMERWYYIRAATDKGGAPIAQYKMLKLEICQRFDIAQMTFGNPQGRLASKMLTSGPFGAIGGALPLCDIKPACREQLSIRCIWYDYLTFDSMAVMGSYAFAMMQFCLAGVIIIILRKREYRFYSMCIAAFGCWMSFSATAYWAYESNAYLVDMARETVWPYAPFNGSGAKICCFGLFLQFLAAVAAWNATREPSAPSGYGYGAMGGYPPMGGMPPM